MRTAFSPLHEQAAQAQALGEHGLCVECAGFVLAPTCHDSRGAMDIQITLSDWSLILNPR